MYEKMLNNISAEPQQRTLMENSHLYTRNHIFQPNQIYTSKATPMSKFRSVNTKTNRNINYKSISSKDESDLLIRTYTPSMYMLKIEIHMHNILFPLLFSL